MLVLPATELITDKIIYKVTKEAEITTLHGP